MYLDLLQQGWNFSEIENMDLVRFIRLQKRRLERESKPKVELPTTTIDELRW